MFYVSYSVGIKLTNFYKISLIHKTHYVCTITSHFQSAFIPLSCSSHPLDLQCTDYILQQADVMHKRNIRF